MSWVDVTKPARTQVPSDGPLRQPHPENPLPFPLTTTTSLPWPLSPDNHNLSPLAPIHDDALAVDLGLETLDDLGLLADVDRYCSLITEKTALWVREKELADAWYNWRTRMIPSRPSPHRSPGAHSFAPLPVQPSPPSSQRMPHQRDHHCQCPAAGPPRSSLPPHHALACRGRASISLMVGSVKRHSVPCQYSARAACTSLLPHFQMLLL